ncbi:hypothetical protein EON65_47185 [archaeon]|nr:MAG: hypothetical protein EON65_47185 [archaeon]
MTSAFQSYFEWINQQCEDPANEDEEQQNFKSLLRILLQEPCLLAEHQGRYLVIRRGDIWPETFNSPEHTFREDFEGCMLFQIPKEGAIPSGQIMASTAISVADQEGIFDEVKAKVTIRVKNPSSGVLLQSFSGDFLIDTGASDTSCPSTSNTILSNHEVKDSANHLASDKATYVSIWKTLAFWGPAKIALRKQPLNMLSANGSYRASRLHFARDTLSMIVEDSNEFDVKSLLLPPNVVVQYERSRALATQIPPREPSKQDLLARDTLILGRDILFKHFDISVTKPLGEAPIVTLKDRASITPPASPSLAARVGGAIGKSIKDAFKTWIPNV